MSNVKASNLTAIVPQGKILPAKTLTETFGMTQILLDANLAHQLKASAVPMELCDPNGNVVGFFTPVTKPKFEIPFTEEEIQKSKKQKGGRSLADILADLERS